MYRLHATQMVHHALHATFEVVGEHSWIDGDEALTLSDAFKCVYMCLNCESKKKHVY